MVVVVVVVLLLVDCGGGVVGAGVVADGGWVVSGGMVDAAAEVAAVGLESGLRLEFPKTVTAMTAAAVTAMTPPRAGFQWSRSHSIGCYSPQASLVVVRWSIMPGLCPHR